MTKRAKLAALSVVNSRFRIGRKGLVLCASALAVLVFGVGTAVAVFPDDNVTTYTGCLGNGGTLIYVKAGDSPTQVCSSPKNIVKLSGGDITSVNVQAPLKQVSPSTGLNGAVTLGLDSKATLPTTCAEGQLIRWNNTTEQWVCRDKYANGTGLGLTSDKTFSINPSFRLPQSCSDGQSPVWDDGDQAWACQQHVKPSTCASGQFATGASSNGAISCAPVSSGGVEVWQKVRPAIDAGTVIVLPDDEGVDVVIMPLPAGTFLIDAVATLEGRGTDSLLASCRLRDGASNPLPVHSGGLDMTDGAVGNVTAMVTIHGVLTLASADTVRFTCTSGDGDGEVHGATMTAVKVGTLHTP